MLGSPHLRILFTPVLSVTSRGLELADGFLILLGWGFSFRAVISGDSKSRRSARSANPRSTVESALLVYRAKEFVSLEIPGHLEVVAHGVSVQLSNA